MSESHPHPPPAGAPSPWKGEGQGKAFHPPGGRWLGGAETDEGDWRAWSLCDRQKRPFRRGRCPQRPAIPGAPPKRADEDIGPYGQPPSVHQKKPHPAIAAQPGALLNKGSRTPPTPTAERQRAGKGAQPQVCTRAGQDFTQLPSRMAPPGPGPQPRRTLVTFLRGKVTRPQAELLRPRARRREIPPAKKAPTSLQGRCFFITSRSAGSAPPRPEPSSG